MKKVLVVLSFLCLFVPCLAQSTGDDVSIEYINARCDYSIPDGPTISRWPTALELTQLRDCYFRSITYNGEYSEVARNLMFQALDAQLEAPNGWEFYCDTDECEADLPRRCDEAQNRYYDLGRATGCEPTNIRYYEYGLGGGCSCACDLKNQWGSGGWVYVSKDCFWAKFK